MACLIAVIVSVIRAATNEQTLPDTSDATTSIWTWIDVIYIFGTLKLLVTFTKYIPQVLLNYRRKSTTGWSIGQILFDFAGGILSLTQLMIDASFQKDWSGVTGNPAKLGLSNISLVFDVVFMVQHYVLYRGLGGGVEEGEVEAEGGTEGGDTGGDESRRPLLNEG